MIHRTLQMYYTKYIKSKLDAWKNAYNLYPIRHLGTLLLTRFNFNPSMDN